MLGIYLLQITDAQQQRTDYTLNVVASKPTYPNELINSKLPESTRLIAQAIWLAAQEDGRWWFEAYQHVAALAESYPPARIVRDALEQRTPITAKF